MEKEQWRGDRRWQRMENAERNIRVITKYEEKRMCLFNWSTLSIEWRQNKSNQINFIADSSKIYRFMVKKIKESNKWYKSVQQKINALDKIHHVSSFCFLLIDFWLKFVFFFSFYNLSLLRLISFTSHFQICNINVKHFVVIYKLPIF